jgi:hypothetical protein
MVKIENNKVKEVFRMKLYCRLFLSFLSLFISFGSFVEARETIQSDFRIVTEIGIESAKNQQQMPYQFSSILSADIDTNENIYVLDYKESCIKVFDKTGKFLFKFLKPGQGPDEVLNPLRIRINTKTNRLYVLHQNGFNIKEFDINGKFIQSHPLPGQMFGDFIFLEENRILFVDNKKYGEEIGNNLKVINLDSHRIIKEFARIKNDYFISYQTVAILGRSIWTCPSDLMRIEAYDLITNAKTKVIDLPVNYTPFGIIRWGDRIQKIRAYNYAQPFILAGDLYIFVTRQLFPKEVINMLDSPIKREIFIYKVMGDRIFEVNGLPTSLDLFPEILACRKKKILMSSSGYDLYPHIKVLEIR